MKKGQKGRCERLAVGGARLELRKGIPAPSWPWPAALSPLALLLHSEVPRRSLGLLGDAAGEFIMKKQCPREAGELSGSSSSRLVVSHRNGTGEITGRRDHSCTLSPSTGSDLGVGAEGIGRPKLPQTGNSWSVYSDLLCPFLPLLFALPITCSLAKCSWRQFPEQDPEIP